MYREITVSKELFSKYKTISQALKVATDGTRIYIKPGTYEENIIIDKQVELIGSGPVDKIIITSHRSNSTVILVMTQRATIRGITIHQCGEDKGKGDTLPAAINIPTGSVILEDSQIISDHGSAILVCSPNARPVIQRCNIYKSRFGISVHDQANPTVRDCKIYRCKIAGVAIIGKGYGKFEHCQIYRNSFSNVSIATEGDPVIRGCKIYDSNESGIFITRGRGTIMDCEIHSNTLSNVWIIDEGSSVLIRCKIYGSKKKHGVEVNNRSRVELKDCQIFKNRLENILASADSQVLMSESISRQENRQREKESDSHSTSIEAELPEVLAELDSLIGLENVKRQIRQTVEYIQFNRQLSEFGIESDEKPAAAHTVLSGNPGTGKTTVARLLGKLYKAMGLLSSGHLVQVNREKLVGEYIGHTAPKTKEKIEEAMGGVLFIDEAYELANKGTEKDFGLEAIAVLLEEMENRRGEFVVVVAGYSQEMEKFLEANPGLKSRFTQYFHLEDYTPDELLAIAKKMVGDKKRKLSKDAEELLHKKLTLSWRKRDRFFGNARLVRNCVEAMMQAQAHRCMRVPKEQWTKEFLLTFTAEDVEAAFPKEETKKVDLPINEELLAQAMEQLNRMIGMKQVKEEIEKLVTLVRYYKEDGRNLEELSPHTLLIGNPGTGKTEVARIIAKIYEALGVLERGDLIEVNRDKLVSIYHGGSEKLMNQYLDLAMGGTLFIDEAYQLTQYGPDDPGHKAVEVLLKRMEDDRGKFIVLVAGYKEKMERFLNSNEGLRRRFERRIEFNDYTPTELIEISKLMLQEKGYRLDEQAEKVLHAYYQRSYQNRDHTFGNAGLARNIVNQAIRNLDYRMAKLPREQREKEQTKVIMEKDLPI